MVEFLQKLAFRLQSLPPSSYYYKRMGVALFRLFVQFCGVLARQRRLLFPSPFLLPSQLGHAFKQFRLFFFCNRLR